MINKFYIKYFISIIIPTYKRNEKLKELISTLVSQVTKEIKIEIIIIGNKKIKLNSVNHLILKKNIRLKSILIKKNSNAIKRNIGLKYARGSNLILIDDDCIPEKNFIKDYIKLFKKIEDKDILCGSVKYLKAKVKKENFTRYRQSRHFVINTYKINKKNHLSAKKIVTMNMGMKNSKLLKRTKYFNEKFGGYGFEDAQEFCKSYEKLADMEGECYISNVIYDMMLTGSKFTGQMVQNYKDWGTLEVWNKYKQQYKTLFVDIDGTLVTNSSIQFPPYVGSGEPLTLNIQYLREQYEEGKLYIILTTSRPEFLREVTVNEMKKHNMPYDQLVMGLPHCTQSLE